MPSSQPLPNQEANLFKKILKSYEQKQYKKSLQYVKEILKKIPDHGETLSMKGLILNYCNKKAEAYECAQKGLRNDVKSHVCWHVYGLLQRSDRKYDEAIKCYRNALRCDPENLQILRDLSLLQIQIRDLEGFRDTRYTLLQLRPGQRVSWIGYAMSYHLLKDFDIAISILEEFAKTQQSKTIDYEQSELLLYQNMVYREANLNEQCLNHLDENRRYILDKLCVEETKGEIYNKLGKKDLAIKTYEDLIERNPDNVKYYNKLIECCNLTDNAEEQVYFYRQYAEKYSRSDVPRKQPLHFLTGEQFREAADKYVRRALTKGVPPLFKELKVLYKDASKLKTFEDLMLSYVKNLAETSYYSAGDAQNEKVEKESPTTLLWVYYYLAQHFDYLLNTERALEFINKAIDYTPTLVELYMIKGKIYKHAGDIYEAVRWLDEAQSLDTADRFVNYKCSKYMLRANMIKEAEEIAGKFTRESTTPFEYLKEMQCMWFETECANAYCRLGQYGEALKKCHQVEKHFNEFIEDQFDFHSYCMRKMTLCSYVEMLRLEDRIKSHPFFFKAAQTAIEVYLHLHDFPLRDLSEAAENTENLSASELKKLRNKQKKQQLKAAQEKEEKMKLEQKKKELNKAKKNDDGDGEVAVEEELLAEKLERPENPLEELNKFLKPLEEFGLEHIETHMLAFEVYSRKNKLLQMLKFLKKLQKFNATIADKAKYHYYLCKFMIQYKAAKATLNETVVSVIEAELFDKSPSGSVESLNEAFLKEHSSNYVCLVEGVKVMYQLDTANNQKKALDILTEMDTKKYGDSLSLKAVSEVFKLIRNGYFGKVDVQSLNQLYEKVNKVYSSATFLKASECQGEDLEKCIKNLSITAQTAAPEADITEKLSKTTLKD